MAKSFQWLAKYLEENDLAIVPRSPNPIGSISNPIVSIKNIRGEAMTICGEDIIVSGLWRAMINEVWETSDGHEGQDHDR